MKVALLNQHTDNFGDDLAAIAHCNRLAEGLPGLELELVYAPHEWGSEVPLKSINVVHNKSLSEFRPRRRDLLRLLTLRRPTMARRIANRIIPRELIDVLERSDEVVISPSGAAIGMYHSVPSLVCAAAAVAYGHRPTFALNTVGSSGDLVFDEVALQVFAHSNMFVRERASYDYLTCKGIPSALGVDSAFALSLVGPEEDGCGRKPIVFVPANMVWHPAFFRPPFPAGEVYATVARALLGNHALDEHPIHILPHVHGGLASARDGILEEVSTTFQTAGISDDRVVVRDDVSDALGYARVLGAAHLVVAMRYHGCVGAAMSGVPFITLAYENKMLEVANYCGLNDLAVRNDQLHGSTLSELVNRLVRSHGSYRDRICRRRGTLQELASGPPNSIILRNWSALGSTRRPEGIL